MSDRFKWVPIGETTPSKEPRKPMFVLGIETEVIPAGVTHVATIEANASCRPMGFWVHESIADRFTILSLQVARVSLIMGSVGVPATLWSSALCPECSKARVSKVADASYPLLPAGCPFQVHVINQSNAPTRFLAGLVCFDTSFAPNPVGRPRMHAV